MSLHPTSATLYGMRVWLEVEEPKPDGLPTLEWRVRDDLECAERWLASLCNKHIGGLPEIIP